MGFDVTYHPMSEREIHNSYFDLIADPSLRQGVYDHFQLTEEDRERVNTRLDTPLDSDGPFNSGAGMFLASVAGFYRQYWYIRGGAFSFILEQYPEYAKYCRSWEQLLPPGQFSDCRPHLEANYMVGCYLSETGVVALLADAKADPGVKKILDEFFSHDRLAVFMHALEYAAKNKLGLIEASEIVEPNPLALEETRFFSKVENCDMQGVTLYMEAVTEQITQVMAQEQSEGEGEAPTSFWQKIKRWF